MVQLITGGSGTGKTKTMIDRANNLAMNSKGHVVYLDDNNRHMFELKHQVRFISMTEYPIRDAHGFLGFLCGVISEDHDIETIFIDSLYKITKIASESLSDFLNEIKSLSQKFGIQFVISINCKESELPEELREYTVA